MNTPILSLAQELLTYHKYYLTEAAKYKLMK